MSRASVGRCAGAALLVSLAAAAIAAGPRAGLAVETRLVLVGGGARPPEAMARFVAWAGGSRARLLVVPWASGEPGRSCEALVRDLLAYQPEAVRCAPPAPLDAAAAADTKQALSEATGVFFAGGDQGRIMDVLADPALCALARSRYQAGVVFGGTSAGTAIMSRTMITGDGDMTVIDADKVGVRPGLGLLERAILDQHFVKRQRQNRLFGLVLQNPEERGLGIDEDTALLVTYGRYLEVVGKRSVTLVDAVGRDRLLVRLLRPGERLDLRER